MNREDYRACMIPHISGKGLSREERKLRFCEGSKLCSGKASTEEEARQLCLAPKPPREPKVRKSRRVREADDNSCDPGQFQEIASQFNNVYLEVISPRCAPCKELHQQIEAIDFPYQVITIPSECEEILKELGVEVFPTVVHMAKGKVVGKFEGSPQETIERMKRGE